MERKEKGRREERERTRQLLAAAGLHLTPEQERIISKNDRQPPTLATPPPRSQ